MEVDEITRCEADTSQGGSNGGVGATAFQPQVADRRQSPAVGGCDVINFGTAACDVPRTDMRAGATIIRTELICAVRLEQNGIHCDKIEFDGIGCSHPGAILFHPWSIQVRARMMR